MTLNVIYLNLHVFGSKGDSTSNKSSESELHPAIVHRLEKRLGYDPQAHMLLRAKFWDSEFYIDPGSYWDQQKERLGLIHTPSESETDASDSEFEP
jgi:hypothetical protein